MPSSTGVVLCGSRTALVGGGFFMPRRYSSAPRGSSISERFWLKVDRSGGSRTCWPWTAGRHDAGYGTFWDGERFWKAHRFAWTQTEGPIPDGLHVLHRCDNPPCCNAGHLFLGTHLDNMHDMYAKGRRTPRPMRGESNPRAKLTWETVDEARRLRATGLAYARIGERLGVSKPTIMRALDGRCWREEWRPVDAP